MTPKSPSQLAEALAKRCAEELLAHHNQPHATWSDWKEAKKCIILQSLPLVELLTCANELKDLAQDLAINTAALTALNTKLTTLLGENE